MILPFSKTNNHVHALFYILHVYLRFFAFDRTNQVLKDAVGLLRTCKLNLITEEKHFVQAEVTEDGLD